MNEEGTSAETLSGEDFSRLISALEILMMKKYCLRNYLDSYKEIINDFVVTQDLKKSEQELSSKMLKFMSNQESNQEFVGKIKSYKDLEFINIRNPEYVLSLLAEDVFHMLVKE